MIKITFVGDIMIEPPVLKAAKQSDGTYNFDEVFAHAQTLFDEADLLIGNLETPIAGAEVGYTDDYFIFNAPDTFADAVKRAGFDMVATSNNHTFDRGYEGMMRTIKVLDEKGIGHHGTFLPGAHCPEAFYADVDGCKIAVIAYTYGVNPVKGVRYVTTGEYAGTVNLLRPETESIYQPGVFRKPDRIDKLFKMFDKEKRGRIKKALGLQYNYPRADDRLDKETMAPYVERFQCDIRTAKENADYVVFYPHVGGQFNPRPGAISEYVMDKAIEAGADAVIASHSHIVQKAKIRDGIPCMYSLGNFNMSPLSSLMLHEYLPDYGLAAHLYVEQGKLVKTTFSILKMVEKKGSQICAWPVDEYAKTLSSSLELEQLHSHVKEVYKTVTGTYLVGDVIQREYVLSENSAY